MAATSQNSRDHTIQLIDKLVLLIEVIRHRPDGLSLDEIATRSGLVKSTAHRILQSLKKHSFVEQDGPGGPYRLGFQFQLVARGIAGSNSLTQLARPFLVRLVEQWNETSYLAVLRGRQLVFVDVEETSRDLRLVGPMAAEAHYHATAAGKAVAAFLPEAQRRLLLDRPQPSRITGRTVVTAAEIERGWKEVRRRGFALNDEETIVGAVFVGAPIFDSRGAPCGSISIGIPKARSSQELIERMAPALIDTCRQLTLRIEAVGIVFPPFQ